MRPAERSSIAARIVKGLEDALRPRAGAFGPLIGLVDSLTPGDWLRLGPEIRLLFDLGSWADFGGFVGENIAKRRDLPWAVYAICTEHPSGFVREAAVSQLHQIAPDKALPHLLLRANDWVIPVRETALAILRERLQPLDQTGHATDLARCIELLAWLREATRYSQAEVLELATNALATEAGEAGLTACIRRGSQAERRAACGWIQFMDGGSRLATSLLDALAESPDLRVRSLVARLLPRLEASHPKLACRIQADFLRDPAPSLRSAGLHSAMRTETTPPAALIRSLLFDASATVRYAAQFFLREGQLGTRESIADQYREVVRSIQGPDASTAWHRFAYGNTPHHPALPPPDVGSSQHRRRCWKAAIAGLGEVGVRADATVLQPLLEITSKARPTEQALARRALASTLQLDADSCRNLAIEWLADPALHSTAFRLIGPGLRAEDRATLVHAIRKAPRLLAPQLDRVSGRLPEWARVCMWLDLIAEPPRSLHPNAESTAELLFEPLRSWCSRSHVRTQAPTSSERSALQDCWRAARANLPKALRTDLLSLTLPFGHVRPFEAADRS